MSKATLIRRDKTSPAPETAKSERPRAGAKPAPQRRGSRLSPGEVALEREADLYAGGSEAGLATSARATPKSRRSGGEPLPENLRALHELRLGRPLDDLRVHAGPEAAREAGDLGARAFAEEGDIVFAKGRYRPDRPDGQALIAHEVAHTAQQADGRAAGPSLKPEKELTLGPKVPPPVIYQSPMGGFSASVYFSQGNFFLDSAGVKAIEELRRSLSTMLTGARVVVDAHASGEGSDEFNEKLSGQRRFAVIALLTQGVAVELEMRGAAMGETAATESETGKAGDELEQQRANNRRVDIMILPRVPVSTEPPKKPIDLTLHDLPPLRPEPPPWTRPIPPLPEPEKISVCGAWSDPTRRWFDHRLRDLGIGKNVREFLAERGVGAVQGLAFGAIGKLAGEAGATPDQVKMIETTAEAACRQELRR